MGMKEIIIIKNLTLVHFMEYTNNLDERFWLEENHRIFFRKLRNAHKF